MRLITTTQRVSVWCRWQACVSPMISSGRDCPRLCACSSQQQWAAAFPARWTRGSERFLHTHGRLQADFAVRLGLPRVLTDALGQSYERWDGKGVPDHVKGERLPLAVRIVTLADVVEVHHRGGGVESARWVAAERAGGHLDPEIVEVLRDKADELLAGLDGASSWDSVIGAEPGLARVVGDEDLDDALAAMADLVDMKSPSMAGHSRGREPRRRGPRGSAMSNEDVVALRRAGFVHDLGRLGISNAIWQKTGPLTPAELELKTPHAHARAA